MGCASSSPVQSTRPRNFDSICRATEGFITVGPKTLKTARTCTRDHPPNKPTTETHDHTHYVGVLTPYIMSEDEFRAKMKFINEAQGNLFRQTVSRICEFCYGWGMTAGGKMNRETFATYVADVCMTDEIKEHFTEMSTLSGCDVQGLVLKIIAIQFGEDVTELALDQIADFFVEFVDETKMYKRIAQIMFMSIDKNNDGKVDMEELQKMTSTMMATMFGLEADEDEAITRAKSMMTELDKNYDGVLNAVEFGDLFREVSALPVPELQTELSSIICSDSGF